MLEFLLVGLTFHCKDFNNWLQWFYEWFQTAGRFIECVVNVWKCIDNVLKWFWNGIATHFGSIEKHCQRFKTQWKCSSTYFQRVENALQLKNGTTLFSLSLLFLKRVTIIDQINICKQCIHDFFIVFFYFFSFVGDQTKTLAWPSPGQDFESPNL